MTQELDRTVQTLEHSKRVSPRDVEFWMGRDIQKALGYSTWESFDKVIDKACKACDASGIDSQNHFRDTKKMVRIGSGASVPIVDYFLTRYACYLITMNGDSRKPQIATAQTYFAYQTRKQELQDQLTDDERRILQRERVRNANRKLAGVAKTAGVRRYPLFQDAGYRGLYGMGLRDVKDYKGLSENDELLDRSGRAELAANEFRITQTEDKLARDRVCGEDRAIYTHRTVGQEVRNTIKKIGGKMPEELPPEPSIKELQKKRSKELTE